MRWPWQKNETRQSGGNFSDAIVRLLEAQAAGGAADASSTAAVEAASGSLSRAFASAEVAGEAWVRDAVTPTFLGQVGRDLVRSGASMHAIRVAGDGEVRLIPCASWHFEGDHDPASWSVRATAYGPSTSTTWNLPAASVVFVRWGSAAGQPYVGTGPLSWAHTTARLQGATESSLADEAGGPVAQLLAVPSDGGDDSDADPLKLLRSDIRSARGKALLIETTQAGWGEGKSAAPQRDWKAARLGASPPDAMATIQKQSFEHVLAACGTPPSLFTDADGTSQREAVRRWHLNLVLPLARMLEHELTAKLETDVRLKFDSYPMDLAGRAMAFQKLVAGGVGVNEALMTTGLLGDET